MRHNRLAPLRLFAALLLLTLLSGCGGGSSTPVNTGPVTSAPRVVNGLQFTLTADKSVYKVGVPVNFTLTVKNVGTQPATIVNRTDINGDVSIQVLQNNQVVWTSPQGGTAGVSGVVSPNYVLSPGQTQTVSEAWFQQSDVTGQQVALNTYTVHASLLIGSINGMTYTLDQSQSSLYATPIQFTIVN